ncbi:MAG: class I SAM-dependent methyltransferase [Candidatus Bipolaricaulota bacterium]
MLIHYFPRLYEYFVKTAHPPDRYELAGEIVGNGSVLDIGCGTGILADHLSPEATYRGIDLNDRLLGYARKKGLEVEKMDCKNVEEYPEVDVYFICDLLHHVNPKHESFTDQLLEAYPDKTIIACEPYEKESWRPLKQLIKLLDYDYVNQVWRPDWYKKEELREFFREELRPDEIKEVGEDMIAIRRG